MSCTPLPVETIFIGDGATVAFQYAFDDTLSKQSNVEIEITTGESVVTQVENVDYTLNSSSKTVTFNSAPDVDAVIRIFRCTDRNRQIDYEGGSTIVADDNLDEDANRLTAVLQEVEGAVDKCLGLNAAGTAWDAEGLQITKGMPGTEVDDFVTLGQLLDVTQGGDTTEIDSGHVFAFTGDGSTTDFALTGFVGLTAAQLIVMVASVLQSLKPGSESYSVINSTDVVSPVYPGAAGGPSYVRFATAPILNAIIEVRFLKGTVVSTLSDNSVGGDQIIDGSIGTDELNFGAGAAGRILLIDADGDATAEVPVASDISDFNAAVRANRLDQMAAPTANVSMNDRYITDLATATENDQAVNYGQMIAAIGNRIKVSSGGLDVDLPTALNTLTTCIANCGFTPDLVIITAKFNAASDYHANWIANFIGATGAIIRTVSPGEFNDGACPPTLKLNRDSSAVKVELMDAGNLTGWAQMGYIAFKFGDS